MQQRQVCKVAVNPFPGGHTDPAPPRPLPAGEAPKLSKKQLDQAHIQTSRKLVSMAQRASGTVRIAFADGFQDEVDLVVGADGIRSVIRHAAFPNHHIAYTGRSSYRTLVRSSELSRMPGAVSGSVIFWHAPKGRWAYTCNLGGNVFEITTMVNEPPGEDEAARASWAEQASVSATTDHFADFHPVVKEVLSLATDVQSYALFAGHRLEEVVANGNIALVGDASHPLSGAFGAGAGFALEDAYVLGQIVAWSHSHGRPAAEGLLLFNRTRSPHYAKLHGLLDTFKHVSEGLLDPHLHLSFDEEVAVLVSTNWSRSHSWIYSYDFQAAFRAAAEEEATREAESEGAGQSPRARSAAEIHPPHPIARNTFLRASL